MSLLGLFEIGKSALMASQTAINTTSHNIANANTEGYNRQEVILNIAMPVAVSGGYLGRGVMVEAIRSRYNQFIQAQLIGQQQTSGRSTVLSESLGQVEQVLNDLQGLGLSNYISELLSGLNDLSANPEGLTQRTLLLQKADSLVRAASYTEQGLKDSLTLIDKSVDDVVSRVNVIASDIARLNESILRAEGGSAVASANDLRNQRETLMTQLADLTEYSSLVNPDGTISISVGMRLLVSGNRTYTMSTAMNNSGHKDIYLDGVGITDNIAKGQLGGLVSARGSIESGPLTDLRLLVASLTKELNLQHQAGFGLDSSTGNDFFNALQLNLKDFSAGAAITGSITGLAATTLHEYTVQFDATATNYSVTDNQTGATVSSGAYVSGGAISFDGIQIAITGAVTSSDTFIVSPLTDAIKNFGVAITDTDRIAASATLTGLPGDNANALLMSGLFQTTVADLGSTTFSSFYGGIVSSAGSMSAAASDSLKFDTAVLNDIKNRRESASGVSLDEEAASLIQFQRSYEAAAKMISIADELMQTILNI